jgi:hypothetical protein
MAFFQELLARFDQALDWPADPFIDDDQTVQTWAEPARGELPAVVARHPAA